MKHPLEGFKKRIYKEIKENAILKTWIVLMSIFNRLSEMKILKVISEKYYY